MTEDREERISIIADTVRIEIESAGYGSWVRDDQIKVMAEKIQDAIEKYEAEE